MTAENRISYQDAIGRATKDIHDRCKVEINLLWDDGHSHAADSLHNVKVWNGLGSLHFPIPHRDLVEGGSAYRQFLDDLSTAVNSRLTLRQ